MPDLIITLDLTHAYKGYIFLGNTRILLPTSLARKLRIQSISPINWAEYKNDLPKTWRDI